MEINMGKQTWKPGNMLYPAPAVLVSTGDKAGRTNLFTVAWTGNVCTNPPMVYISVRPERYSCELLDDTGEFVINLTTEKLVKAADYCGVRSGRDVDKWIECGLTKAAAQKLEHVPLLAESPVNIECRVREYIELGSHRMYLADVLAVDVDEAFIDDTGKIDLAASGLIAYSHGEYTGLGKKLGTFGYSVRRKKSVVATRMNKSGKSCKPGRTVVPTENSNNVKPVRDRASGRTDTQ